MSSHCMHLFTVPLQPLQLLEPVLPELLPAQAVLPAPRVQVQLRVQAVRARAVLPAPPVPAQVLIPLMSHLIPCRK